MFWLFANLLTMLLLPVAGVAPGSAPAPAAAAAQINPEFALYLASDASAAGNGTTTVTFDGHSYHLQPEPIITGADIAKVSRSVAADSGRANIRYEVAP